MSGHRPLRPTGRSRLSDWPLRNVHERWLAVSPDAVWELLAGIGSDADVVWPRENWPPMKLDAPLSVGTSGGHGAVRYRCTALVPRRLIEFTFDSLGGRAFDGHHAFEVLDRGGGVLLRHTIDAQVPDRETRWWFRIFVQPTHDVVIEELFHIIESLLGQSGSALPRWSPWVRLLRRRRGLPTRQRSPLIPGYPAHGPIASTQ